MERRRNEGAETTRPGELTLDEELAAAMVELRKPIPPEEVERRRKVVSRMLQLRAEIGPIGVPVTELIREVRGELDDGR